MAVQQGPNERGAERIGPGYSCPSLRGSDECCRFGALGRKVGEGVLDSTSSRPEGEGPEDAVLLAPAAEGS